MGFLGLFRKKEKQKYIVDKTPVDKAYIESRFQFLIDSGYNYKYYQKYSEREFIYRFFDKCSVEIFLEGYYFTCIIQTSDFPRSNIMQNPLVDKSFEDQFLKANNLERINMVVNFLYKNSYAFLLN